MKRTPFTLAILALAQALSFFSPVAEAARLSVSQSGSGPVPDQVIAHFSADMVALGTTDSHPPLDGRCEGDHILQGRWQDPRTWVIDLPEGLSAGQVCLLRPVESLKALDGEAVEADTGYVLKIPGPVVLAHEPESWQWIDENQAFILRLNGRVDPSSLEAGGRCHVGGMLEALPLQRIEGEARRRILEAAGGYAQDDPDRLEVVRCARPLPAKASVRLEWGEGIRLTGDIARDPALVAETGDPTHATQTFDFTVRDHFHARLRCSRDNPAAGCNPLLPIRLLFSAPVDRDALAVITLKDGKGRRYKAQPLDAAPHAQEVEFAGPFPPHATLTLNLPKGLRDDAGRTLLNAEVFPLRVAVHGQSPLVKFAGDFGILESTTGKLLPLTLRHPGLRPDAAEAPLLRWQSTDDEAVVLDWMQRMNAFEERRYRRKEGEPEFNPDLESYLPAGAPGVTEMALPTPLQDQTVVIGVPLPKPGFYQFEAQSRSLGRELKGVDRPMFVRASALVTNLAVHVKRGSKNSLAWVTRLDNGRPVPKAQVVVRDCTGRPLGQDRTNAQGIAHFNGSALQKDCLFVSARSGDDLSFARSEWTDGIEPWRFNLPTDWQASDVVAHTVLDRTLFRPGETVHMRHFIRQVGLGGLGYSRKRPPTLEIRHQGSDERWFVPLTWNYGSATAEWILPKTAKRGEYGLRLLDRVVDPKADLGDLEWQPGVESGGFNVGDFRVPLMKAVLTPLQPGLVGSESSEFDVGLAYQNGGGARGQAVTLRGEWVPRYGLDFEAYPDYRFGRAWPVGEDDGWPGRQPLAQTRLALDAGGSGRGVISGLPMASVPGWLNVEMEYSDPNGEIQTVSQSQAWWPASVLLGVKEGEWAGASGRQRLDFLTLDLHGKPVAGAPVEAFFIRNDRMSYRVRLAGGFYGYRHDRRQTPLDLECAGVSDAQGRFSCEVSLPPGAEILVNARTRDAAGREARSHRSLWTLGEDQPVWFAQDNHDRIDLLPEKKTYQPGETARLQVRMPFREATALVTIERDGVLSEKVVRLSGKKPVIEVPVKANWAPNVYVSVLLVRGRVGDIKPTALVDLGKPAFKLGIANLHVGQAAQTLAVAVQPDREVYQTRERAKVKIQVTRADGKALPRGTDVILAAVDEGLLELAPNGSWHLLEAMLAERGYGMETFTAQMQVTGKRHFGKKALPPGGGGGLGQTRELFDTLLYWNPALALDEKGEAEVEVPLNDSLTAFRIVAIAAGQDRFGRGEARIRSTRDLQWIAGLPPVVRSGDRYTARFTLRNGSQRPMRAAVTFRLDGAELPGAAQEVALAAGEGLRLEREVSSRPGCHGLAGQCPRDRWPGGRCPEVHTARGSGRAGTGSGRQRPAGGRPGAGPRPGPGGGAARPQSSAGDAFCQPGGGDVRGTSLHAQLPLCLPRAAGLEGDRLGEWPGVGGTRRKPADLPRWRWPGGLLSRHAPR